MYQVPQGEYEKIMGVNPSLFTEKQMEASKFKPPLRCQRRTGEGDPKPAFAGTTRGEKAPAVAKG